MFGICERLIIFIVLVGIGLAPKVIADCVTGYACSLKDLNEVKELNQNIKPFPYPVLSSDKIDKKFQLNNYFIIHKLFKTHDNIITNKNNS